MLEKIVGNNSAARLLTYLYRFQEGYAVEIARYYGSALSPIQNQLQRFEDAGILQLRSVGKVKLYSFSQTSPLVAPLKEIIGHQMSSVTLSVLEDDIWVEEINLEED